jgi:hypothetical protein
MVTVTIVNQTHNTSTRARVRMYGHADRTLWAKPSNRQLKRIHKDLCGRRDCLCGPFGIRGDQYTDSGEQFYVDCTGTS